MHIHNYLVGQPAPSYSPRCSVSFEGYDAGEATSGHEVEVEMVVQRESVEGTMIHMEPVSVAPRRSNDTGSS